jgi:hypothetical protein
MPAPLLGPRPPVRRRSGHSPIRRQPSHAPWAPGQGLRSTRRRSRSRSTPPGGRKASCQRRRRRRARRHRDLPASSACSLAGATSASPRAVGCGSNPAVRISRSLWPMPCWYNQARCVPRAARSQRRTVDGGRPSSAAIRRRPRPWAFASRAAPMTSAASARRGSSEPGCNTWVARQVVQRARRGRTVRVEPSSWRTGRLAAYAHGRSTPARVGAGERAGSQVGLDLIRLGHDDHCTLLPLSRVRALPTTTRPAQGPTRVASDQPRPPTFDGAEALAKRRHHAHEYHRPDAVGPLPGAFGPGSCSR